MEVLKSLFILFLLLILTVGSALILGELFKAPFGNVALIRINGKIILEQKLFSKVVSSDEIISQIEKANEDPRIKALLVEINSPGGTVVAVREVFNALKSTNKTKVCWLRDIATSGAYWIASACDSIVADEFTITGGIGVSASYLEFSEFFKKYGIGYVRIVSGEKKDIGSPFKEPTEKELEVLEEIVNEIYNTFLENVAKSRNLSFEKVKEIADGSIFIGKKAKELGLIDVMGGKDEAIEIIKEKTNLTYIKIIEFEKKPTFMEMLSSFL